MNQFINRMLRLSTLYVKLEIVAGLVLTMIILLYAIFPNSSQQPKSDVDIFSLSPTTQK